MKSIVLLLAVSVCFNTLFAQENRVWATYFGGAGNDGSPNASSVVDDFGNIYIVGSTTSNTGIFLNGFQNSLSGTGDAFLSKFDPNGNLIWSTYYGGPGGELGMFLATDGNSCVYLLGNTISTTGIASGGFQNSIGGSQDAFLVKFDLNGNRIWATYYGGPSTEVAQEIAVDNSGNVLLSGVTQSSSGIASGGYQNTYGGGIQDAFLVKFNSNGTRLWATYFGGTQNDAGYSVAFDISGNIYFAGGTSSSGICFGGFDNTLSGTSDAFLVKFNSNGGHLWSTYYGGTNSETGMDLAVDLNNDIYFSGNTNSSSGIAASGFQNTLVGSYDGFLVKFNSSGNRLWATYYGGIDTESNLYVTTDNLGKVYVSGYTASTGSIASGGFSNTFNGVIDAFLVRFSSSGARESATYFGGSNNDQPGRPSVDQNGSLYLSGYTESTSNISSGGYQNSFGGGTNDAFLVKFNTCSAAPVSPGTITGTSSICSGTTNTYSITPVAGANSYTWTLPSGWTGTSTTNSITATSSATSGNITVTANNACGSSVAATLPISVNSIPVAPSSVSGNTSVCQGSANTYSVSSDPAVTSYTWTLPGGWSGSSTTNSITTTAGSTGGNIEVSASNSCGTSPSTSVVVSVSTAAPSGLGSISGSTSICSSTPTTYSVAAVPGATSYTWSLPAGWTGTSNTNSITVTDNGTGGVISVFAQNACGNSSSSTLTVAVSTAIPSNPGSITGNTGVCLGSSNNYSVSAVSGATSYSWTLPAGWSGSSNTNTIAALAGSATGNIIVTANNSCGSSSPSTLSIIAVLTTPVNPGPITGSTSICEGSTNTYAITPAGDASSYTWTLPPAWLGTSTSGSISTTSTTNGGTLSVTATNFCGTSTPANLTINVVAAPATPGSISGPASICEGSSNNYSIASIANATSYTWTLPVGWSGFSTNTTINGQSGTTGGTISVVAENACGNSSPQTLTVSVNPLPVVSFSESTDTLCEYASSLTLTGGSPSGGIYSGSGVTAGTFNPSQSGLGDITITYTYTDANSCSNTATDIIVVDACAGLENINTETVLIVYPSPTAGNITVLCSALENSQGKITIYNTLGETILTVNSGSVFNSFDFGNYSNGIYLIEIRTKDILRTTKVIKQ